jgi:hypothetical protein
MECEPKWRLYPHGKLDCFFELIDMKIFAWILVLALLIAHQDYWNWDSDLRMFYGLPIGLVYHIGLSIAAAVVWWIVCLEAWPKDDLAGDAKSARSVVDGRSDRGDQS